MTKTSPMIVLSLVVGLVWGGVTILGCTKQQPGNTTTTAEPSSEPPVRAHSKTADPNAERDPSAAPGTTFKLDFCPSACAQAIECGITKSTESEFCNHACEAAEEAELALKARDCVLESTTCSAIKACDGHEVVLGAE